MQGTRIPGILFMVVAESFWMNLVFVESGYGD